MSHALTPRDRARLQGVHPDLVRVVMRCAKDSPVAFMVVEGLRSKQTMWEYWGKGRTAAECSAAGVPIVYAKPKLAKVTWLKNPLASNHRAHPSDGLGRAVDLLPAPYDWKNKAGEFDILAKAMLAAAKAEGVEIRWGADWDRDGIPRERGETDSPHFELAA